jgi:hypothetical protein
VYTDLIYDTRLHFDEGDFKNTEKGKEKVVMLITGKFLRKEYV